MRAATVSRYILSAIVWSFAVALVSSLVYAVVISTYDCAPLREFKPQAALAWWPLAAYVYGIANWAVLAAIESVGAIWIADRRATIIRRCALTVASLVVAALYVLWFIKPDTSSNCFI